jgi:hypothetical protein
LFFLAWVPYKVGSPEAARQTTMKVCGLLFCCNIVYK